MSGKKWLELSESEQAACVASLEGLLVAVRVETRREMEQLACAETILSLAEDIFNGRLIVAPVQ